MTRNIIRIKARWVFCSFGFHCSLKKQPSATYMNRSRIKLQLNVYLTSTSGGSSTPYLQYFTFIQKYFLFISSSQSHHWTLSMPPCPYPMPPSPLYLKTKVRLQNNKLNASIPCKKVCRQSSLQMNCCCTEPSLQWGYLSSGVRSLRFFFLLCLTGGESLSELWSELQDIKQCQC